MSRQNGRLDRNAQKAYPRTGNVCPVCGYDNLERPANPGEICPSCGTIFGESDAKLSHAELRHRWCRNGGRWWDEMSGPPPQWSALQQLRRMGYSPTPEELSGLSGTLSDYEEDRACAERWLVENSSSPSDYRIVEASGLYELRRRSLETGRWETVLCQSEWEDLENSGLLYHCIQVLQERGVEITIWERLLAVPEP